MDAEDERLVKKSRISSADLYSMGAITSDRVYQVVKERAAAKVEAMRRAREDRAAVRTTKNKYARDLKYVNTFNDIKDNLISRADAAHKKEHSALKSKADVLNYVLEHVVGSELPEGAAPQLTVRKKQQRRRLDDASDSSESEGSHKEDESESEEELYEMEAFVDACKRGGSFMLKDARVEEFIAEQLSLGLWPPTKLWRDV
ncbi:hypothetical protein AB1Y20_013903 [Prymnesium parvum]|uniref:Non-structural maintenance of chromosomes element 4 n=1 Tax=Prymnesium parvum TaxID=97485 RepID=A0AB34IEA9_PRYPA